MLTQHKCDEELLKNIMATLGCGRYFSRSDSNCGDFIVEKFSDITEKILPFFEAHPLHGIKNKNFNDFKKVAFLMKDKVHLKDEGIKQIQEIKNGMNSKR